jgi:hypothetical protein
MNDLSIRRRDFLRATAAGAAGAMLAWPATAAAATGAVRITDPFHGAVLNRRMGTEVDGGLRITVTGEAPPDDAVTVNGAAAKRAGKTFTADVVLREEETDIVARAGGTGGPEHRVRVVWDRYSRPRYRFSVDDNSFFLRDIAQKKYASLFDCFYLKAFKDLNAKYGAKFVLNIYYTTGNDFDLTQFPDRYRGEWKDNAGWLRLAFHAYANEPNRPYQDAPAEKLVADLDLVAEQIRRFAGEETYTPPTVIHWGMTRPEAFKPLAGRGVRVLSGYFCPGSGGWDVNYRFDAVRSEYLWRHDALMDFDSGIIFSRVDIICNSTPLDKIVPTLEPVVKDPNMAEVIDLFTHEQYFWPFYAGHTPDQVQRLDAALRFVTERGYKPVFFHEGYLCKK